MNEEQIVKILKTFSRIKPSEDFIRRSRPLILAVPQKPRLSDFKSILRGFWLTPALVTVAVMLLLVVGSLSYYKINDNSSVALDNEDLLIEAGDLSLDIHLKEAQYFDESIKEVAAVLEKVTHDKNGLPKTTDKKLNKGNDNLFDSIIL